MTDRAEASKPDEQRAAQADKPPVDPIPFGAVCAAERESLGVSSSEPLAALCLSGGGIRSAAFSLGVVTGLARAGVLDGFHFLSTVSGGGYTGSWLSAWIHRSGTRRGVLAALCGRAGPPRGDTLTLDPAPVRHVRAYCSYLSPRWGLMSADAWTLLGTYLRNLVITAVVLVPLMAAAMLLPWLNVAVLRAVAGCVHAAPGADAACIGLSPPQLRLFLYLLSGALAAFGIAALRVQGETSGDGNGRLVDRLTGHLRDDGDADLVRYFVLPLTMAGLVLIWLLTTYPACSGWRCFAPMAVWGAIVHWVGRTTGGAALAFRRRGRATMRDIAPLREIVPTLLTGLLGGAGCRFLAMQLPPVRPPDFAPSRVLAAATLGPPLLLVAGLTAATVFVGLVSYATSEHDREFWARSGSWFLVTIVLLLVGHGIALYSVPLLHAVSAHRDSLVLAVWGAVTGSLTATAGFSPRGGGRGGSVPPQGWLGKAADGLAIVAAPLFLLQTLVVVAAANAYVVQQRPGAWSPALWVIAACALLLVGGFGAGWLIKLDEFSLHAMYNNRLTRTFLGASRLDGADIRRPDPFTGFDPKDDLPLHEMAAPLASGEPRRLLHVVNMALNIGRGVDLADQHRKAVPFTVTCLHAGARRIGYRSMVPAATGEEATQSTKDKLTSATYLGQRGTGYGGKDGLSLGTAMTISGAAASPNMGFHTSAIVTFIMTLLNIRLGRWLGNTGEAGATSYATPGPRVSSAPIIQEAFRITGIDRPYVFLSDGGHFENLGLYEMVMRRCRLIVVADASADPKYLGGDLARAVQLIRLDLSVPITFHDPAPVVVAIDADQERADGADRAAPEPSRAPDRPPWRHRFATIHYSDRFPDEPDGVLLVLKPAVFEDDPPDVRHLRNGSDHFPHDQTTNQWFTEEQFEGYRMLGEQTVSVLSADAPVAAAPTAAADADATGRAPASFSDLLAWFGQADSRVHGAGREPLRGAFETLAKV